MSRASRGRLDRPLSLRDVAGKEASIEVVVGCGGGASMLEPGGGGSCEICCDGVASTSAIVALGKVYRVLIQIVVQIIDSQAVKRR